MIGARSKPSPRRLALRAPSADPLLFEPTWTPALVRRLVRRDPDSPIAAWRQIAEQLREAIAIGQLPPGTMLPPLSSMTEALDVYLDAVLRAYHHLRDQGLLVQMRGRGTWVTQRATELALQARERDTSRVVPADELAASLVTILEGAKARAVERDDVIVSFRKALGCAYPPFAIMPPRPDDE